MRSNTPMTVALADFAHGLHFVHQGDHSFHGSTVWVLPTKVRTQCKVVPNNNSKNTSHLPFISQMAQPNRCYVKPGP